jgi:hypothetical protein
MVVTMLLALPQPEVRQHAAHPEVIRTSAEAGEGGAAGRRHGSTACYRMATSFARHASTRAAVHSMHHAGAQVLSLHLIIVAGKTFIKIFCTLPASH